MTLLWQYVALLAGHYVADFLCQSSWMATNKSKDNKALLAHVAVYSAIMLPIALALFGHDVISSGIVLALIACNAALHFATDFYSSRVTTKLWRDLRWRAFFNVIGFDQLIHQVTLAALVAITFGRSAA